jgi:ABC-type uncharacterized transport system auxiliary subunit
MKSNVLKKICVIATTTLVLCGCADQEMTEAVPDSQSAETATQEISNVADEADTVEENTAIEDSTQTSQDTADNASEQDKIVVERTGDIPEEYEDGSIYKKTFEEAGITTYTPDEMEKILEDKE